MKLTDKISAKITGNGREQTLLVFTDDSKASELVRLKGTDLLVASPVRLEFVKWAKKTPIDDIAKQLEISRARAGRIRKALGLSGHYAKS